MIILTGKGEGKNIRKGIFDFFTPNNLGKVLLTTVIMYGTVNSVRYLAIGVHDGGRYSCEVETDAAEPLARVHIVEILG